MERHARVWIWLCFVFCAISTTWCTRKYNVELEALKLYKEDFKTVLYRFRRTSDYLKILQTSLKRLVATDKHMAMATMFHYKNKLKDKVKEAIDLENTTTTDDFVSETTSTRNYIRRYGMFRNGDRNVSGSSEDENMVDLLDKYKKLNSKLTVKQKNEMKNLGFMYAGEAIHKAIKNLKDVADEDCNTESTKASTSSDTTVTVSGTTTHVSVHEVTDEVDTTAPYTEDTTAADPSKILRFRVYENDTLDSSYTMIML